MPQQWTATADRLYVLDDVGIDELILLARKASEQAYCPYSKFRVGAAVVTTSGRIFSGCNVENASYDLTICAERNAIFHSVAEGEINIVAVVIFTPTAAPAMSCGACRQVINEFGPAARVLSVCDGLDRIDTTANLLLPWAFGPRNLM